MTPEEYIAKVDKFLANLVDIVGDVNYAATKSISATLSNRIVLEGTDKNGTKYRPYSVNGLPPFFFDKVSESLGNKAKVFIAKKKKDRQLVSYAEFRTAVGRQTDHRSLSMTGEMWGSLATQKVDALTSKIYFQGERNNRIAEYNKEDIGDFMQLSEEEEITLQDSFDELLQQEIERIGL